MEVKINREIRNYTESMFFGLSMRQFVFFFAGGRCRRGTVFSLKAVCRDGNGVVDVCSRRRALCGYGIYHLPRHDRREIHLGVDSLGVFRAERDSF